MGLFGSIFKGMGFDKEKSQKKNMEKPNDKYANFDTGLGTTFSTEEFKQNPSSTPQFPGLGGGFSNLVIYAPKDNNDIKILIECLRRKEACIVNLAQLKSTDAEKILQFLSGAVYALKGSIKRLQGDLFLMTPEGVGIMQGKK